MHVCVWCVCLICMCIRVNDFWAHVYNMYVHVCLWYVGVHVYLRCVWAYVYATVHRYSSPANLHLPLVWDRVIHCWIRRLPGPWVSGNSLASASHLAIGMLGLSVCPLILDLDGLWGSPPALFSLIENCSEMDAFLWVILTQTLWTCLLLKSFLLTILAVSLSSRSNVNWLSPTSWGVLLSCISFPECAPKPCSTIQRYRSFYFFCFHT